MKTRNGFISNSSSSSFVIIGRMLNDDELTQENFENKNIQSIGGVIDEGQLVMNMTWEMFQFIQENEDKFENMDGFDDLSYYEVFFKTTHSGFINKNDLPDGNMEIIIGEFDHYSPNSISELKRVLDE